MAIFKDITFKQYLALPGFNSSLLKGYSVNPRHGFFKQTQKFSGSRAMNIGTLAHCLILEGEDALHKLINTEFVTEGFPINETSGKPFGSGTKTWAAWESTQPVGTKVMLPDDLQHIEALCQAVCDHPVASNLLSRCSFRETAITWKCHYTGEMMKALLDGFGKGVSMDLKTFARPLTMSALERVMYDFKYHLQFSMYRDGLEANNYETEFHAIFVQSTEEHDVACCRISDDTMEQGRADYIQAIANFHLARQSRVKTGAFPNIVDLGIPSWSLTVDTEEDFIKQIEEMNNAKNSK